MQLTTAAAHIKSLSSSDLFSRRSVAKTGTDCASSVDAVVHSPSCDGSMSIDSCRSDASDAITMMDVDPLRTRRDEEDMSLDISNDDERFRREVCGDSTGAKEGDSVGDVSMGDTVKGSIGYSGGLNGRYWLDFELEMARCEDAFGMDIPCRRLTRSRMKMAAYRSENSYDVSLMEGTQHIIPMDVDYEEDRDVQMGQGLLPRRIDDEEDPSDADDDDDDDDEEESVMSELTADVEGDFAFDGLDVQAIDVCQERMDRMQITDELTAMEVDDDEGSVVVARYLIKSTEVIDQHKPRVYFTRGLARLLMKRTRSGLCY